MFRNINLIPFRVINNYDYMLIFTINLGPTDPCMSATRKETSSTTVFKAKLGYIII